MLSSDERQEIRIGLRRGLWWTLWVVTAMLAWIIIANVMGLWLYKTPDQHWQRQAPAEQYRAQQRGRRIGRQLYQKLTTTRPDANTTVRLKMGEQQINDWLAAILPHWQQQAANGKGHWPQELKYIDQLQIQLQPGRIRIMALVTYKQVSAPVSAVIGYTSRPNPDGSRQIRFYLEQAYIGRRLLPDGMTQAQAEQKAIDQYGSLEKAYHHGIQRIRQSLADKPLFVPASTIGGNDDQVVQVIDIQVRDQQVEMTCVPAPDQAPSDDLWDR